LTLIKTEHQLPPKLSDFFPNWPKKLLNVRILQLILWLIIANRPNAKLHS